MKIKKPREVAAALEALPRNTEAMANRLKSHQRFPVELVHGTTIRPNPSLGGHISPPPKINISVGS